MFNNYNAYCCNIVVIPFENMYTYIFFNLKRKKNNGIIFIQKRKKIIKIVNFRNLISCIIH